MPDHVASLDFLAHLRSESARFAEAVAAADPSARVPSCPDWDADDLLWHLADVQWFWGTIVAGRLTESPDDEAHPPRPSERAAIRDFYDASSATLAESLETTADDVPMWTWSNDHTAGFIRRRQAHEALIHRVDAELTAGTRTPLDPDLSDDGIDEVLRVMYGGVPTWGTFTARPAQTIRFGTTDTGHTWVATLGQFVGTDPDGDTALDVLDLRVADTDDGAPTAAEVRGSAADLDCWLWRRPALGEIERTGDPDVLDAFDATISDGID
jgi:uncharacterized protein (TIGR03083 family)